MSCNDIQKLATNEINEFFEDAKFENLNEEIKDKLTIHDRRHSL